MLHDAVSHPADYPSRSRFVLSLVAQKLRVGASWELGHGSTVWTVREAGTRTASPTVTPTITLLQPGRYRRNRFSPLGVAPLAGSCSGGVRIIRLLCP